ncbi:hypothetical protein VCSRO78_0001 [Vibrio cholerae]|nr:hypothetical protein VCSRO78_0001 [Vibrio cholerae]GIB40593.1 hypothetical protein VCSRO92_1314 [Vibrio cholerae]
MAIAQLHHLGFQLAAIAQGQDHGVVHFGVAAHGTAQGHAHLIVRFRFVDGVVAPHHDWVEVDAELRWRDVHASIVGRGAGVSSRIDDARIYLVVPFRQWGGHIHAVAAVRLYRSGQGLLVAVGIGHDQGNGTARRCIRRTGNGRGGVVGIVRRIDRDHWRSHIHATLVTRGAGVSCRIGDARIYLVVSFRQRDGHIHAVAAVRLYRSDQGLLVAVGIGHDKGNGTARRGIRRTDNGRGSVVGVVRRMDSNLGGGHIDTAIVGRGAGVASRIGHSGGDGIRAFRQWGGHFHAVAAVRLYRSGQGLLVAACIGHDKGNGTARRGIRRTGNGRGSVVGVVRRINCDHWRCHIHAALVTRGAGIPRRIGHCGGDGIRAFRQRGNDIHTESAIWLHDGGQGLLVAVGIGHDQGNGTARRGIRRTGNGRGGVVGVVWGINSDN